MNDPRPLSFDKFRMSGAILSFTDFAGHHLAALTYPAPAPDRLPVVWIHGLTASVRFWEKAMYAEVSGHRTWHSLSLPFHYPSSYFDSPSADSLDEKVLSDLVARSVERLIPTGRFHLVGYSLGAFAALNYAAKHPGRVASVVSIGGFMTGRAKGLEAMLQFLSRGELLRRAMFHLSWWILKRHVVFLKLATLCYARRWRQLLRYPYLDSTLRDIFPDVRQHSVAGQRALFRYLLDMDLMEEVDDMRTPTLFIAGERDPIIPYAHQRECARRLPGARFVSLPGVGHVAFAEAPEVFKRKLVGWLNDHG